MFYDNFVRFCNSVNKSPSFVAGELGLSRATVSGWKNGKIPTDANQMRIAEYFGISVDELMNTDRKVMFYERYIALCSKAGEKPYSVAKKLGLGNSNVAQWKKGSTPRPEVLSKIAEYLGVTVEYLLTGEEQKAPASESERRITEEDIKLALFGGSGDVTDEMWKEATFAIELIKDRYRRKKEENE